MYSDDLPLDNRRYRLVLFTFFWWLLVAAFYAFGWEEWSRADKLYHLGLAIFGNTILGLVAYYAEALVRMAELWVAQGPTDDDPITLRAEQATTGKTGKLPPLITLRDYFTADEWDRICSGIHSSRIDEDR